MNLLIVESPTKAKTIKKFLDDDFLIKASLGHVRDLPEEEFGVDIKNDFRETYIILPKRKTVIKELKKLLKTAQQLIFATDEDREGEAIAWHIAQTLRSPNSKFQIPNSKIKRIVFHEITKKAILDALKNPRDIDLKLVDSYRARRVLDRIVGYKLSPFLWKKVAKGLSAGRVQSPALRLICEQEVKIENFKPQKYYKVFGVFVSKRQEKIKAVLNQINKEKIKKPGILEENLAKETAQILKTGTGKVLELKKTLQSSNPPPPYTTSLLQQDAWSRLFFSAKKTMILAQKLYEAGFTTYHRTDSMNLSQDFINKARSFIAKDFGDKYLEDYVRRYKTKSKVAFEAHEAIRPTKINNKPETLSHKLNKEELKLYELIFRRTLATQMKRATIEKVNLKIKVEKDNKDYLFEAMGLKITFDGFMKIFPYAIQEKEIPEIEKGELLNIEKVFYETFQTKPPSRFSDAKLVKTLESFGIGRPSTYAQIISILLQRSYIERDEKKKLKPTEIGEIVNKVLTQNFQKLVDYNFTSLLEEKLDKIAQGKEKWTNVLTEFYKDFEKELERKLKEVKKDEIIGRNEIDEIDESCPNCGSKLIYRFSRFGKFISCSTFPKCKYKKDLRQETGLLCPKCQEGKMVRRKNKKGQYFYGCTKWPSCNYTVNKLKI